MCIKNSIRENIHVAIKTRRESVTTTVAILSCMYLVCGVEFLYISAATCMALYVCFITEDLLL